MLAALLLPLAGLFAPDAQAQTTRVLVSNIGESGNNSFGRQSQPFTTGGNTAGYGLTSVERIIQTVHATNGILVRIAPSLSGGGPDLSNSDVVTLTNPGTITPSATTTNTFSAPAGTVLAANTTYHVVVTGADGTAETYTNRTASDAEDSGAASGWSIGNERYFSNPGSTSWFRSGSLRLNIRINGTIRTGTTTTDTTAPRVTSIERNTPTTTPTNADNLTWRVTFNEDVKDVGDADFGIAGTTETLTLSASAVSGSASQYDVTVSGAALADLDATLTLSFASGQDIKDIANNNLTDTAPTGTNDFTFVVDNTAPTVTSIERGSPTTSPTNANSLAWQVTFSEALHFTSPGPGTDDFVVSGTTASAPSVRRTLPSSVFNILVAGGDLNDLNGTVTLSFATGQNITDPAGNALVNVTPTSGTNDNFFLLDNTAPTVTITAASTSTGPFTATFTFDEAVTGFILGDITVGNGAPSNLQNPSSDNRTFTATITPVATGTVTVNVAANVAEDAAGNGNTAAAQVSISHTSSVADTTAPTVTSIVRHEPTTSPTNANTLTWRVTFNENVKDVGDADFEIAGPTGAMLSATAITGSTSVYDVTASGGDLAGLTDTVTLSFASGQDIKDNADNNLTNTTDGSERTERARPSLGTRMYSLRWAAMVVISLGAGWMARDLMGPAGDVARGAVAEPVVTRIGLQPSADQERLERDNAGGLADTETLRKSQAAAAGRLAEAETPPESPDAAAVGGVALGSDRGAGRFDDDAVLDQVEALPARQRAEAAVARGVGPADANVRAQVAEPQVEALSLSDELRRPASAADRRDGASLFDNAAPGPSAAASLFTTPFLVPGLPVRDVRLAPETDGLAGGRGGSVVVTQELKDGRVVELQFVPVAGNDPALGEPLQERTGFLGRTRPAGWGMAVRDVPGGVAVLSGPLTERELEELLDRMLGPR